MSEFGAGEKLKVFISYSRRDSAAFADELVAGLELGGFAPFLDRHDIAAGEDWEARLGGLIEQSDTVVFVVSPEAVKSDRCAWEVDRTIELSKRLLPVIFKPVPEHDIPEKLRRLQFIRFDSGPGFARLSELAAALRVDLQWIREHTRLGEMATRWDKRGRPESLLLRGDDLDAAKAWMAARKAEAPEITDAQGAFVRTSEEVEATRLGKERAQLEATARQQRRIAWLLGAVAVMLLAMLGYVTWQSYDVARRELNVFTARATDALNDEHFDLAMRYALQAYPARGRLPWTTPFSTELEGKLAGGALSMRLHHLLNGVGRAAFSRDGKRVVTVSKYDHTARVWDAQSGKEITVLNGHTRAVFRAAFSGDGKRVVTVSYDQTVRIWDAESGKEIAILKDQTGLPGAQFSGDGKRVVIASSNTAHIWDAESGKEIAVLKGHTESVLGAAFSEDATRVVTASNDKTARIWDVESGKEIAVLKGHDFMRSAVFSPDGKRVLTTSYEYTPRIWDAESGKEIAILKGHTNFISAAFSRDGTRVVTASDDKTARMWDAESGKEITVLKGHTGPVHSAALSADGKRVVTASEDSTTRIWDAESGDEIAVLKGHTRPVFRAAFSDDSKWVLTASEDNTARVWDAESSKEITVLKGHTLGVFRAAFSGDGKRVVTVSYDGTARIWDAESGKEFAVLEDHHPVLSAAFSGDGKQVVTGSFKTTRIWDAESGKEIAVQKGLDDRPEAFSANGKRVLTISADGARIWDAESGKEIAILKGRTGRVQSAAFSGDGKQVVTAYYEGIAGIWDVESGKEIAVLYPPVGVNSVAFSGDGKQVVTASHKTTFIWRASPETARVWNAPGENVAVLKGHSDSVLSAAFSADGTRVVTGSRDNTVRIWDAESGKEIAILKGHTGQVQSVAFSADGKLVVTASEDGTARIWDVTWATLVRGDDLRERVCSEKLIGGAQEFTDGEIEDDPILRGIDKDDPIARNPCLRRGQLSLDYWTRLPGKLWRLTRGIVGMN